MWAWCSREMEDKDAAFPQLSRPLAIAFEHKEEALLFKSAVRGSALFSAGNKVVFWWVIPGSKPRCISGIPLINLPHAETRGAAQTEKSTKPNHITNASVKAIFPTGSGVILSHAIFCHHPKSKQARRQSLELLNLKFIRLLIRATLERRIGIWSGSETDFSRIAFKNATGSQGHDTKSENNFEFLIFLHSSIKFPFVLFPIIIFTSSPCYGNF